MVSSQVSTVPGTAWAPGKYLFMKEQVRLVTALSTAEWCTAFSGPSQHSPDPAEMALLTPKSPLKRANRFSISPLFHIQFVVTKCTDLSLSFYGALLHQGHWMGVAGMESHMVVEVRIGQLFMFSLKHFSFHRVSTESTFQEGSSDKKFTGSSSGKWPGFCINACRACRGRYYKWCTLFPLSQLFLPQILIYSVINLE